MLIKYCQIDGGNFGDDLNTLIWSQLFPDLSALKGAVLFYGIGTLLDGRHNRAIKKVVLGTGIGEINATMPDPNWDFRWVRGLLSAREFNLPTALALGDSSLLWSGLHAGHNEHGPIGLIPHYRTWDSYDWDSVAANAGMVAINPRQAPSAVIAQMRNCSRILSESLHGAICADAIEIPWASCILAHRFNEFKWKDWLSTIQRPFTPFVTDRPLIKTIRHTKAWANQLARWVRYKRHTRYPALRPIAASTDTDAARVSDALARYGRCEINFYCSKPSDIARQKERMLEHCSLFASDYNLRFNP